MTEARPDSSLLQAAGKLRDYLIIVIRHRLPFLYPLLEGGNNLYCSIRFGGFKGGLRRRAWEGSQPGGSLRVLGEDDAPALVALIEGGSEQSRSLFTPHQIDENTFRQLIRAPYYLAVGYHLGGELAGYAFLKLYFPKKAFAGYFVADNQQGKGIGKQLFRVIREIAGEAGFDLYTHVKEENIASMRISPGYVVHQRIPGGYLVLKHIYRKEP